MYFTYKTEWVKRVIDETMGGLLYLLYGERGRRDESWPISDLYYCSIKGPWSQTMHFSRSPVNRSLILPRLPWKPLIVFSQTFFYFVFVFIFVFKTMLNTCGERDDFGKALRCELLQRKLTFTSDLLYFFWICHCSVQNWWGRFRNESFFYIDVHHRRASHLPFNWAYFIPLSSNSQFNTKPFF
jgi:hypothetical protein